MRKREEYLSVEAVPSLNLRGSVTDQSLFKDTQLGSGEFDLSTVSLNSREKCVLAIYL